MKTIKYFTQEELAKLFKAVKKSNSKNIGYETTVFSGSLIGVG